MRLDDSPNVTYLHHHPPAVAPGDADARLSREVRTSFPGHGLRMVTYAAALKTPSTATMASTSYPLNTPESPRSLASTNPACAQNTAAGAICIPGSVALAYYSDYGAPTRCRRRS